MLGRERERVFFNIFFSLKAVKSAFFLLCPSQSHVSSISAWWISCSSSILINLTPSSWPPWYHPYNNKIPKIKSFIRKGFTTGNSDTISKYKPTSNPLFSIYRWKNQKKQTKTMFFIGIINYGMQITIKEHNKAKMIKTGWKILGFSSSVKRKFPCCHFKRQFIRLIIKKNRRITITWMKRTNKMYEIILVVLNCELNHVKSQNILGAIVDATHIRLWLWTKTKP